MLAPLKRRKKWDTLGPILLFCFSNPITSLGLLKGGFTRATVYPVYVIYLYEEATKSG